MGSKQVRLDGDVYAKIEGKKRTDESFSDAIDRLTFDWSLAEWGGWMDDDEAAEHREMLDELAEADRKETDALLSDLGIDTE